MADTQRSADREAPVVPATAARQGRSGRAILWVLVIGTFLAAIALFAAWAWKAPGLSAPGAQQRSVSSDEAKSFHAPEPAPVNPQPGADHTKP